ncbi:MAG: hypothetical protein ACKOZU_01700 [Planctomycetaceae bacterium]
MASTADKRRALAELAAERNREGAAGRFVKRAAAAIVLLLLILVPALWAAGFFSTPQPVAEVRRLVDEQVAEYARVARGEVPYASAQGSSAVYERMREMPRAYREQVGQDMGRLWEARERAETGSYFALPPAQREAELDRRIRAEEERRQRWQAEREKRDQQRAAEGQQAGGANGRGSDGGDRGGGQANAAGGGGGPGGGAANADQARLERGKRRLDGTTPEERAQQAEYRRALDARRTQLGIQTGGRRGG